jgi:hypothetical protein
LGQVGLLRKLTGKSRNRVCLADEAMRIIEEPLRLPDGVSPGSRRRLREDDMRRVILAWAVLLLAGCATAGGGQRIATPVPLISRQAAIDIALKVASTSHPEMSGALTAPENIQAELTTLVTATRRLTGSDSVDAGDNPDMAVWLVTMDGTWTDEFPRQTGVPAPEPYHHYGVILNARSGESISISARP